MDELAGVAVVALALGEIPTFTENAPCASAALGAPATLAFALAATAPFSFSSASSGVGDICTDARAPRDCQELSMADVHSRDYVTDRKITVAVLALPQSGNLHSVLWVGIQHAKNECRQDARRHPETFGSDRIHCASQRSDLAARHRAHSPASC